MFRHTTWNWIIYQKSYPWGKVTLYHSKTMTSCISSFRDRDLWNFSDPLLAYGLGLLLCRPCLQKHIVEISKSASYLENTVFCLTSHPGSLNFPRLLQYSLSLRYRNCVVDILSDAGYFSSPFWSLVKPENHNDQPKLSPKIK